MAPDASAQFRIRSLVVCPGLNGYRLAFVAGTYFEVLDEFPTWEAARAARNAAETAIKEQAH
jgi:hypothetical protein